MVQFGTGGSVVRPRRAESLLRVVERFGDLGGTQTADAVRTHYRQHDRVLIVTDEQAWGGWHGEEPTKAVPAHVPVYTWNVAGYLYGHGPSGTAHRHTFGGLSDGAFTASPLLERGRGAAWTFRDALSRANVRGAGRLRQCRVLAAVPPVDEPRWSCSAASEIEYAETNGTHVTYEHSST
jgi:hypothetical protein